MFIVVSPRVIAEFYHTTRVRTSAILMVLFLLNEVKKFDRSRFSLALLSLGRKEVPTERMCKSNSDPILHSVSQSVSQAGRQVGEEGPSPLRCFCLHCIPPMHREIGSSNQRIQKKGSDWKGI